MCKNTRACFNKIIWLIIMKMRVKMKNRSHRYDINRARPRHGHEYTKYKFCLSTMVVMSNKQQLGNIWSWIHEKVKQHWGLVEKSVAYIVYKYIKYINIYISISIYMLYIAFEFFSYNDVFLRTCVKCQYN